MEKISVLIVDDHQLSALGAKAMIQADERIKVQNIVNSGKNAIDYCLREKPDVVLLDIMMPEMDGFEAIKRIKNIDKSIKIILMTINDDRETIIKALAFQADGLIFKDVMQNEMLKAIHKVHNNGYAYSPRIIECLMPEILALGRAIYNKYGADDINNHNSNGHNFNLTKEDIQSRLTIREFEVLSLIGEGMSTQEISQHFNLSKFTINTYRKNIHAKLNISNHKEMMDIARIIHIS